ncbi:purine-nucleoside phosphorylase [Winkia sp. ACRQY]|uniref:Uridine phosphorylase n=1 Tax=Winkia neuii BV029A5 TaxID=888439 RepID=K0YP37_9ACTO|nr:MULTISPECIES: purine-nucleoside phosphorylase [Winkia]PLB80101.1 purine-nucleoside phosphorylase [Actinomyces sp. UMB0138]EJZ85236.1 purine nucleoside phosphorylase [Winkia neuii BV029A5]MCG7302764.1 purine-nucleoside phosphorylase [Winkia sp. ACRQY]MDK7162991.1 purine-nucleoside phosphorylase [Winkia sp. UMB3105]MDK7185538.1 purine-nucleoside phosphorylase [Winkia sp. UMB1295B]
MQQTPHINPTGPIANTVLMPGDPLRAKFIAETYLRDVVQFNAVRGMLGFTGTYEGAQISVMGSGMGIPSISLYAHELIHFFGVRNIIRVGSCGALQPDLDLYDVVVASSASTDSNFINQFDLPGTYAPTASWDLLEGVYKESQRQDTPIHVGNILSSDVFYNFDQTVNERWAKMGVLAVEMESAGLYSVAAEAGANALGIFTVSDNIVTDAHTSAQERQEAFTKMIELTLPVAAKEADK